MTIERIIKEIIYIAIMVASIRASQWLTMSNRSWTPVLVFAGVYLLIRIVMLQRKSPAR